MKHAIYEGDRVEAMWQNAKGMLIPKRGVVADDLSIMYFVIFDDGTDGFCFKKDSSIKLEELNG